MATPQSRAVAPLLRDTHGYINVDCQCETENNQEPQRRVNIHIVILHLGTSHTQHRPRVRYRGNRGSDKWCRAYGIYLHLR